jgi:galactokinase
LNISSLKSQFTELFPATSDHEAITVQAPGRVNLIGEHTDYNDGFVCPMAIDRSTTIVCRQRGDKLVRMHSNLVGQTVEFPIDRQVPKEGPAWALYAKGVVEALRQQKLVPHGMDALVDSDLPAGGGLSSSASFEIATGLALLTANDQSLEPIGLALAGQWAEHHYGGVPCGIMDQFISALGKKDHALLLDCRDQSFTYVPVARAGLRVVIANSNVKHALMEGAYGDRHMQCRAAVRHLHKINPRVKSLRDATPAMLEAAVNDMDPVIYKRTKHVVTEIQRTLDFAAALENNNYAACGELMYKSHQSLRDDFQVSCAELDTLVAVAAGVSGVYGARMTGGGFGGCIVVLVMADAVDALTATLQRDYWSAYRKDATIFSTLPSAGAHVVL